MLADLKHEIFTVYWQLIIKWTCISHLASIKRWSPNDFHRASWKDYQADVIDTLFFITTAGRRKVHV